MTESGPYRGHVPVPTLPQSPAVWTYDLRVTIHKESDRWLVWVGMVGDWKRSMVWDAGADVPKQDQISLFIGETLKLWGES